MSASQALLQSASRLGRGLYRCRKADAEPNSVGHTALNSVVLVLLLGFSPVDGSVAEHSLVVWFFLICGFVRRAMIAPLDHLLLLELQCRLCQIGTHCSRMPCLIGVSVVSFRCFRYLPP